MNGWREEEGGGGRIEVELDEFLSLFFLVLVETVFLSSWER